MTVLNGIGVCPGISVGPLVRMPDPVPEPSAGPAQIADKDALAESHLPAMMIGLSPLNGLPGFYGLGWNVNYAADGRLKISHSGAFAYGTGCR